MIELTNCHDVKLQDFSDRYRRMWSIHLLYCKDVTAKNLNIRTSQSNGDGIDVDSTTDILIDHCDIDTGDDSISLKSGRGQAAVTLARPTQNVMISNCTLGSAYAGVGIGTEMSGGIANVRIEHCTFTHGSNAIYIKSRTGRAGYFQDMSFQYLDVGTRTFLGIDLINKGIVGTQPVPPPAGIPLVKNLSVSDVTAHCGTLVDATHIDPAKPIENLTISNITGTAKKAISIANAVNVDLKNIKITGYSGHFLTIRNVTGTGLDGAVTAPTTEPTTRPIAQSDIDQLRRAFDQPSNDAKPMVRWWWFGPNVTQPELEREMTVMHDGGFGGFEVQPTYPLSVDNNQKFLSQPFLDDLKFVAAKAKQLGLRMDLTLGSGWPYGGATIPITQAAGKIRVEHGSPMPTLRDGETLLATFAVVGNQGIPQMLEPGAPIPAGATDTFSFISSRTGMKVKRPALGAEGYVIDHQDPAAVKTFIDSIATPEISACGENSPYAIFCDSLESYSEDWTPNLLEEFQKRRGYDLRPLLPALIGDIGPKTLDIRHDWGQTLTEVFNDYFMKQMHAFAKDHNTRFRIQAYGQPSAGQFSYADADLPEGEGFQWHGYRASRYAASACHLLGIKVASSETFTWIHSPVFRATPLDIKAEADLHFLQGINQLICHGWPSTPPGVAYPGWSFYASGVFNDNNPWYIVMPDVTKYIQRVSSMLRQGTPANDIALYLPNDDAWAHFTPGKASLTDILGQQLGKQIVGDILDAGYNFDFFDDELLASHGKIDNGVLSFGDVHFKVIILANVERIPPATMRKLDDFVSGGGILIATGRLPDHAPGYQATAEDQQTVQGITARLFNAENPQGIFIKDESQLPQVLAKRLAPDVACSPASPQLGVVHRHTNAGEMYFLANTSNEPLNVKATLRVENMEPEWWNPMTGRLSPGEILDRPTGRATVALNLEPYGSTILLWTHRAETPLPAPAEVAAAAPLDLTTGWTVQFGKDGPPIEMAKLHSWTDDAATRKFSGVATYSKTLTLPPEMLANGLGLTLDFGQPTAQRAGDSSREGSGFEAALVPPIREAAIVYINGQRAGSLWCPPYRLDATGLLKAGDNQIRIDVANTAVNILAANGFPNYDYRALVETFGNRFTPARQSQFQPLPSGLLGPVQLIPYSLP